MGTEEAIHILIKLVQEYAKHFTVEEVETIISTGYEFISLCMVKRTPEEEDAYKSLKNGLCQAANKLEIALINEGKSLTHIGTIIKILS